ncbi:methionine adenosyltransferase sam2 [Rhodotorula kratochvilovae]
MGEDDIVAPFIVEVDRRDLHRKETINPLSPSWNPAALGAYNIGRKPTTRRDNAAYTARWIAKSLVNADLADRVLVQLSYAIGVAEPLSIFVDSYGTVKHGKTDADLTAIILKNWDLRCGVTIDRINRALVAA